MKTNFQMLMELSDWYPEERGFISGEEIKLIDETFDLENRDALSLQNLRDFVVCFYASHTEKIEDADKMSAITAVIDNRKFYADR